MSSQPNLFLLKASGIKEIIDRYKSKPSKMRLARDKTGWVLLAIAFLVGCLTIYWGGGAADEADNLVVGTFILRGFSLYRDVFSHHFPFPYYWMASVVSIFGKSVFIARLSVWVFQILSFALAMRFSRYRLTLGLTILTWSLIRSFYLGNMVLYSSFSGVSLLVVCVITLAILQRKGGRDRQGLLTLGFYSVIAILSDPLSAYAVAVSLVCLFLKDARKGAGVSALVLISLLGYMGYLLVSRTLPDFLALQRKIALLRKVGYDYET